MPETKGQGNPDWTREETILALDLLYRHEKPLDRHHEEVIALSALLRQAAIHPLERRRPNFRNPDGVALKLQNLLSAIEPGRGLGASRGDKAVVDDYPRARKDEVATIARSLRSTLGQEPAPETMPQDEVFVEGRWLTARHRQRDQRLRQRLLAKLRGTELRCEICEVSPPPLDRELQESHYEAHHRIPLAEAEGERTTRVADMALLCACCHRLIHKLIARDKRWVGVEEARLILGQSHGERGMAEVP